MSPLQPFSGASRKLVLAFDVGTTYSGVAYAILDPGEVPKIQGVTRFPGQENAAGDSKIPSILYYDQGGKVRAVGAEAALLNAALEVDDEDLIFVEWFKLHLRPDSLDSGGSVLPPLPPNKTAVDVFADFLKYLLSCARRYIVETHANGQQLWTSLECQIEFVLSHPNGWEGLQQSKMRRAAVAGCLIKDTPGDHNRIHFVTEGEAGLQFCVQNGLAPDSLKKGHSVMVVDAGGGTVDLSTYTFACVSPVSVEEVASPDCLMHGSTCVNARAHTYLQALLRNSSHGNSKDLKTMIEYFEKNTKPIFRNSNEASYQAVPHTFDSLDRRISDVVASFFEPSIKAIADAAKNQCQTAATPVKVAFFVGGFAASPWLFIKLQASLQEIDVNLLRPNSHTNKAVAEGAVSFYLEHFVSVRMARITYGTGCLVHYNKNDDEHFQRRRKLIKHPSGHLALPGAFRTLLQKGTRMRDNGEVSHCFTKQAHEVRHLDKITSKIVCYRGRSKDPRWVDIEPERFSVLCKVYADTSSVVKQQRSGLNGVYYAQTFRIVLLCGLTELKAQLSWIEKGKERRGPAEIVYDDDAEVLH